jgi:hypothetical protein
MKKYGVLLCFTIWTGVSAFAAEFSLSAGGGGLLGYTFTRYTLKGNTGTGGAVDSVQTMDRFNYAACLFLDAAYGEFSVLIQGGNSAYRETMTASDSSNSMDLGNSRGAGTEMSLGFSLLGKYPFEVTERITWFPLFGVEYQIALLEWRKPEDGVVYDRPKGKLTEDRDKDNEPYPLSAWNSFWIDVGAGLDYDIAGPLYVRGEFLFGFRLPTVYEMGALELVKKMFDASDLKLAGLTGSPSLKIGLGYRF